MKILYDGLIYSLQRQGGINRYYTSIVSRLPKYIKPYVLTEYYDKRFFPKHKNLSLIHNRMKKYFDNKYTRVIENIYYKKRIEFIKADIIHPTYYQLIPNLDLNYFDCSKVITVHDMIYEIFNFDNVNKRLHIDMKKEHIDLADAIICVSNNTKKDLMEIYDVDESKIKVIYHGSEISYSDSFGNQPVPEKPYYLFVGSRYLYKNFSVFLKAFKNVLETSPGVSLCIVGPKFNAEEYKLINELKLQNSISVFNFVDDNHLAKLYRCSTAYICPSLYEGFCIPAIEAMKCGTPIISSNVSSIPEVVGDAAILINPRSMDDLVSAMKEISINPGLRNTLINKGFERAKLFSWEKTVSETLNVYKSVC